MRCWNCGKKISDMAKVCRFCEATVDAEFAELMEEEKENVREILRQIPADLLEELREPFDKYRRELESHGAVIPEELAELRAAFDTSETADTFADRIFVGDCPKCGSEDTGNCEADPEIEELLVGRCYQCGQLWCTECRRLLEPNAPTCPCWEEDDEGPALP